MHEAAVFSAWSRRRGRRISCRVACRARTANREDVDDRVPRPCVVFGLFAVDRRFVQQLRELGWSEGRNLAIEYRWADGRRERFVQIATEFVRLKVDVIVTLGAAGLAAKQVTSTIPIVLAIARDPIASGLVASLARPGGNVTGLSIQTHDLVGKRLELLREVVPRLRRLAILVDGGYP